MGPGRPPCLPVRDPGLPEVWPVSPATLGIPDDLGGMPQIQLECGRFSGSIACLPETAAAPAGSGLWYYLHGPHVLSSSADTRQRPVVQPPSTASSASK